MKKSVIRWIIILVAILVVYHVVIFALPIPKTSVFWVSYLFTLVAIITQIYVIRTAFYHGSNTKSKFYGFPIAKIGVWYLIVQLVAGLIFMGIGAFIPVWIPLVVYALLLCVVVIGLVAADAARDEVERQDAKTEKSTSVMRNLQTKVATIASCAQDKDVSLALQKLAEEFRFSDPVSGPALREIEVLLSDYVEMLAVLVKTGDKENFFEQIQKVKNTLKERNQLCRTKKGNG